jgi:cell division protein FtsN
MPDRATELAATLENTEKAVRQLSETVNVTEASARRSKTASMLALVGIACCIVLTAIVGWGYFRIDHNQDRINTLQATQTLETGRNREAQCAIIELFLQFEPRTLSNPTYSEQQRYQQIAAYQTLRQIRTRLECVEK